jgi:replication factor A1
MPDSDIQADAEDIHAQLPDSVAVTVDELADDLDSLVNQYSVPRDEARRSVLSKHLEDTDLDREDVQSGQSGTQSVAIESIDEPEQWIDLTAKVVDLWDANSDAVAQVGLLGDETGTIKFTKWAKSDLPSLTEGEVYHLTNLVTDEYQGQYSVKLNSTTTIEQLDREIEVGTNTSSVSGALVDIQKGSGLIKRCPHDDCTRVLQNGRCSDHGQVDGEFDLRIKAVIDTGDTTQDVIFDREATGQVADISLEEAKTMAQDALDTSVVADEIRDATLGRYYRVDGPEMGRYLLVDDFEQLDQLINPDQLLITARSM